MMMMMMMILGLILGWYSIFASSICWQFGRFYAWPLRPAWAVVGMWRFKTSSRLSNSSCWIQVTGPLWWLDTHKDSILLWNEWFFFRELIEFLGQLVDFFHVLFGLLSLSHTNIRNISFHICFHIFWEILNLHHCLLKDDWNGPFARIHSHHPFGPGTDCNWRCSDETPGGRSCSRDGPWSSEVNDSTEHISHISKNLQTFILEVSFCTVGNSSFAFGLSHFFTNIFLEFPITILPFAVFVCLNVLKVNGLSLRPWRWIAPSKQPAQKNLQWLFGRLPHRRIGNQLYSWLTYHEWEDEYVKWCQMYICN